MTLLAVPALLLQSGYGDEAGAAAAAGILGMGVVMMLVTLAIAAVFIIGMWKVFTKAGQPGWAALIPIYNTIVLLQMVGRPIWWIVLFCIPFVNFVAAVIVLMDLAKSFGQGAGFVVLMLLGGIGILVLGFGSARYVGPAVASGQLAAGTAA